MKSRSITFRLGAWYAGVSLLVYVAFGLYTYFGLRYYLSASETESLRHRMRQIGALLATHLDKEGETFTVKLIRTSYAPAYNDHFIRIWRPNGTLMYISGWPTDHSFDPRAVPRASGQLDRRPAVWGHLLLVRTFANLPAGRYEIECGASRLPSAAILRSFRLMLGLGLPLTLLIAVTGGAALARRALRPVREIIDASRAITSYNLGRRLPVVRTDDELELLSVVLNQMIGRLDEAFQHARRFNADASHELRTPLTIMRMELESVNQETHLAGSIHDKIASVLEETERLARTVEGLFAISRLEAGEALMEVTRLDLSELVSTTAEQMALLAEEQHIAVRLQAPEPVQVAGDRFRLKQVIVNLLDNAIKYSPAGGEIILASHPEDGQAVFQVADRGPGIPAEALPQVFDRFFRVDSVRTHGTSGAGLGLSIVRSICLAHGGTVEAANRPKGGCRITVRLPLVAAPLAPTGPKLTASPETRPAAFVSRESPALVAVD